MSLRAALLLRVSTDSQVEDGTSLETQNQRLTLLCEQEGMILIERVLEAGVSGRRAERPGIQRLLELAEQGLIDVVFCLKLDRFARSLWRQEQWIQQLQALGVAVRFAEMSFENTPTGAFQRQVMGAVSELEASVILARTLAGRKAKSAAGKIPGYVEPYGYRFIRKAEAFALPEYKGRDGTLEIVESEARVVRELFARYLAGTGYHSLAAWLNDTGVPLRRGKLWMLGQVRAILTAQVYMGLYPLGHTSANPDEWQAVPVPPIISGETWQAAEARRAITPRGRPSLVWMLRGCIWCATCPALPRGRLRACQGKRSTGTKGRKTYESRSYLCATKVLGEARFCGTRYAAIPLEADARREILAAIQPGELVRRLAAIQAQQGPAAPAVEWGAELEQVNGALALLVTQALGDLFPAEILAAKAQELTRRRTYLEAQLRFQETQVSLPRHWRSEAEERAASWRRRLDGDHAQEWQAAAQEFLTITLRRVGGWQEKPVIAVRLPWLNW